MEVNYVRNSGKRDALRRHMEFRKEEDEPQ